jgi:hypothetical protein
VERWRCCPLWQRCLNHKWNAREFAAAHGVQVPQLYWSGHRLARLPIESLPRNVVLKPSWGYGGRGAYLLAGTENLKTGDHWNRSELRDKLVREHGPFLRFPFFAEEMMTTEEGLYEQGSEYNVFMFGGVIGAIMCVRRHRQSVAHYSMYTQDWTPITTPYLFSVEPGPPQPPPAHLEELCRMAICLGKAVGTFMRVDLYSTHRGVVFGEFSSTPRSDKVSPFGDHFFGEIWQREIPDCA